MRATIISTLVVAAFSAGICAFSLSLIDHVSSEIDVMRAEVVALADDGRVEEARLRLKQTAEMWLRHERQLAVLVSHETLHEITGLIVEGDANLTAGDLDDFTRSMALLGEAIGRLGRDERLTLSNLL